jgi:hypothetical protein
LAGDLNKELPVLEKEQNKTKHTSFVTENMRSNLDEEIRDSDFNFQLIKTYNKFIQFNNRLSFIDSPTVY